ncbi:peptidoglycan endopeptidase [Sphingorhabdus sp.]|uniref:peptidoglycan endopeptidase n=1 Tax=Sphingorhabdus sp. TaxID=1902408 RepID=UPI00391BE4B2
MPIRIEAPRTQDQANIAACAVTLLGAPFQLYGRSVQTGLDCVGVAACCLCAVGDQFDAPTNYSIRGSFEERAQAFFAAGGFDKVRDPSLVAGDLLLLRPGHRQIHFAVLTMQGAVHAHMGLARVVLTPLPLPYPEIARWRFKGD